jgi:bifunctional UDP-N-acetylglucosamine pyrophosphorylase / glucosamine-1-phosphate N-acetyltransferase
MTSRLLIVPAAGLGTRLGGARPKLLVPVAGMPMIDRLLAIFAGYARHAVVVTHPSFTGEVTDHLRASPLPATTVVQQSPTGMLDAIMLADDTVAARDPDEIWIVWCDQVGIHPATVAHLATAMSDHPAAALTLPTVRRPNPYIHLERDDRGRIVKILHRREGDPMPPAGESDMGLFALPRRSYAELLPAYAREVTVGSATHERNFLPFIVWANRSSDVVTFPATDEMEAVGVNTPEELAAVERYLRSRESRLS